MKPVEVLMTDVASAERLFERWLGFDIHGAAPRRLKDFLASRAAQLGYANVHEYLEALPPERPTSAEAQRLVNMLTNGLTAFWRDPQQLQALASLLSQLHERYGRTLDVWCAGSATGEEAYSVAIAAREMDVPIRVLGTDINTSFLDDARRGDFDSWSLRRLSEERRARWFTERDGRWALERSVASVVEFRHHNLLDMPPTPPSGAWDAILCRNVVIYLTDDAVSRILMRFAGSIAEDGYLLLGSSEQIGGGFAGFRAVQRGPTFVYRPVATDPGGSLPLVLDEMPDPVIPSLDEETAEFFDEAAVLQLLKAGSSHDHDTAIACYEAARPLSGPGQLVGCAAQRRDL
jgi:chemotaxis protein methyltransferase CheR